MTRSRRYMALRAAARRMAAAATVAAALAIGTAAAPGGLPGIGAADPRAPVDGATLPWSALARLQVPGVSRCTAVLLSPGMALTAAHCLYSARLGHFVPASSVHVLSRYASGGFAEHRLAASIRIADGYDPRRPDATRGHDAALLELAGTMDAGSLALAGADPAPGTTAMLGGYSQDRAEIITADRDCHVARRDGALLHDCTATRGTSGAPVVVREDGAWRIAGLAVGAAIHGQGGFAVPLPVLRSLLAAAAVTP